jgi:hypothetical protein
VQKSGTPPFGERKMNYRHDIERWGVCQTIPKSGTG